MDRMLRPPVVVLPDRALIRDTKAVPGRKKRKKAPSRKGKAARPPSRKRGRRKSSSR